MYYVAVSGKTWVKVLVVPHRSATRFTLIHLNMSSKIKDCLRFWKGAAELNGPPVVQIKAHIARKV